MEKDPKIIKQGYIKDFATGKVIDGRKPEEVVRQEYEKELHEDYGYAKEQMDIEVSIQRGEQDSLKNKNERADIVIYTASDKNKRDQSVDIIGIVETKRPTRKEGVEAASELHVGNVLSVGCLDKWRRGRVRIQRSKDWGY